jgi:hypothetical protein
MKWIASSFFIAFVAFGLLGTPSTAFSQALPPCPEDPMAAGLRDNCFGTYTFANGNKYVGEWQDGKWHGQGTMTFADGAKYVGEWQDGDYHGQGTFTFPDGEKYVGEYKDGFPNGLGTYTYADGAKYVGEFRDDEKNGVGTLVSPNGTVLHGGLWLNGEPVVKR